MPRNSFHRTTAATDYEPWLPLLLAPAPSGFCSALFSPSRSSAPARRLTSNWLKYQYDKGEEYVQDRKEDVQETFEDTVEQLPTSEDVQATFEDMVELIPIPTSEEAQDAVTDTAEDIGTPKVTQEAAEVMDNARAFKPVGGAVQVESS